MTEDQDGGCACGRLRYRLRGEPIFVNACHCRDCQRLTGSAFAVNAMIEADRVVMLGDGWSPADVRSDAAGAREWRCATCGVLLFAEHHDFGDAIRFVRVGTLDENETISPDAHFFVRSKHPWIAIPEGLPAYDTGPQEGEALFTGDRAVRLDRAMAGRA